MLKVFGDLVGGRLPTPRITAYIFLVISIFYGALYFDQEIFESQMAAGCFFERSLKAQCISKRILVIINYTFYVIMVLANASLMPLVVGLFRSILKKDESSQASKVLFTIVISIFLILHSIVALFVFSFGNN